MTLGDPRLLAPGDLSAAGGMTIGGAFAAAAGCGCGCFAPPAASCLLAARLLLEPAALLLLKLLFDASEDVNDRFFANVDGLRGPTPALVSGFVRALSFRMPAGRTGDATALPRGDEPLPFVSCTSVVGGLAFAAAAPPLAILPSPGDAGPAGPEVMLAEYGEPGVVSSGGVGVTITGEKERTGIFAAAQCGYSDGRIVSPSSSSSAAAAADDDGKTIVGDCGQEPLVLVWIGVPTPSASTIDASMVGELITFFGCTMGLEKKGNWIGFLDTIGVLDFFFLFYFSCVVERSQKVF